MVLQVESESESETDARFNEQQVEVNNLTISQLFICSFAIQFVLGNCLGHVSWEQKHERALGRKGAGHGLADWRAFHMRRIQLNWHKLYALQYTKNLRFCQQVIHKSSAFDSFLLWLLPLQMQIKCKSNTILTKHKLARINPTRVAPPPCPTLPLTST